MQNLIQKTKAKLKVDDSDDEDGRDEPGEAGPRFVTLKVINPGHTTIRIDSWPMKNDKEQGFALATYRQSLAVQAPMRC